MKKVLVLILALAMVLTSFVMPAMAEEEPVTLSLLVKWQDNNLSYRSNIFDEMAAELGIVLDITVVESEAWGDRKATMFMSGDYPEALTSPDFSNTELVEYGTNEGFLIPLEEYLTAEIAPNLTARLDENPAWRQMITMPDGHIYGIPSCDSGGSGHGDVNYKLWISNQWLDAVGMEMPTTIDEFCDVLRAFKEKDPNGNGIADEIGLTGAQGTWAADPWLNLMNCFGVFNESYYYIQGGEVHRIADTEYFREGLSYLNAMYEEGLIDPAAFTQDLETMMTVGAAEHMIAGAVTCGHVAMYLDIANTERFTGWETVPAMEGPSGHKGVPYTTTVNISGSDFSITDVCEHPEIAMQLADLAASEYWTLRHQVGQKGVDWDDADEGTVTRTGEPALYKYLNVSYSSADSVDQSAEPDNWDWTWRLLETNWKPKFQLVGDIYDSANYEAFLMRETVKHRDNAYELDSVPPFIYENDDVAADAARMSADVTSYVKASIAEFITGVKDIDDDAVWNQYLTELEGYKYTEWLEIIQNTINLMGYGK